MLFVGLFVCFCFFGFCFWGFLVVLFGFGFGFVLSSEFRESDLMSFPHVDLNFVHSEK